MFQILKGKDLTSAMKLYFSKFSDIWLDLTWSWFYFSSAAVVPVAGVGSRRQSDHVFLDPMKIETQYKSKTLESMIYILTYKRECHTSFYDVIWENPAYEGANNVFLDLTFSYIYIHRLLLNFAVSPKRCFLLMLMFDKKSRLISDASQNVWHLIKACSFRPSISRVFRDHVIFISNLSQVNKGWQ